MKINVDPFAMSSLHNIILNTFRVVLVLWRQLHRVELSLSYVIVVLKKSSCGDGISFFRTTMTYERGSSTRYNSLHNTKTTQYVFNIILWRLLHESQESIKQHLFKLFKNKTLLWDNLNQQIYLLFIFTKHYLLKVMKLASGSIPNMDHLKLMILISWLWSA